MIGAHAVRVHTYSTEKVIIVNLVWNKQNWSQVRSIHKMRETPVSRRKSDAIHQMRQTPSPERDDGINLHIPACIEQRAPWSLISAAFWNGGGQKNLIINSRKISGFQFLRINTWILTSRRSLILSEETISPPLPDLKRSRNLTPASPDTN